MQRRHLLSTGALLGLGGLLPATAGPVEAAPRNRGLVVNNARGVSGARGASVLDGTFVGSVRIQRLSLNRRTGALRVHGLISGGTSGGTSAPNRTFANRPFTAPATLSGSGAAASDARAEAVCQILNLDIGRITLNLLGLVIDIAPISINITAIPGGGLLGSLLCALAGLLNPLGAIGQILMLLRQINRLLDLFQFILNLPNPV